MEDVDRVERLLALILINQMKGAPQREKILQLSLAGFTNYEIAELADTTYSFVAKSLSVNRKRSSGSAGKTGQRARKVTKKAG